MLTLAQGLGGGGGANRVSEIFKVCYRPLKTCDKVSPKVS